MRYYDSLRPEGPVWKENIVFGRFIKLYDFAISRSIAACPQAQAVLDAATGLGYGAHLASSHFKRVVGIDISQQNILYGRSHYTEPVFLQGNILHMPFNENEFDAAISIETLEHLDRSTLQSFCKELKRVVKPGGVIVISTPNRPVYSKINKVSDHLSELNLSEFKELVIDAFHGDVEFYSFGERVGRNLELMNRFEMLPTNLCNLVFILFGLPYRRYRSLQRSMRFWDIRKLSQNQDSRGYLNIAIIEQLRK